MIDLNEIEKRVDMLIETETAEDIRNWLDRNRNNIYLKAESILSSVQNEGQLEVALNYIECYFKSTRDKSGYDVLIRKYVNKSAQLNEDKL